jgi:hypothetical protein
MTVHLLFRKFMRDSKERGFRGYFSFIDPSLEAERRFVRICRKSGGIQIESLHVGLVGAFAKVARG